MAEREPESRAVAELSGESGAPAASGGREQCARVGVQVKRSLRLARLHQPRRARALQPALRLVAGLAAMVVVGTLTLMLPICGARGGLSWNQAFFTSVSALATTGLSIITPGHDLSRVGQFVLLVLMQVGGVGYMVLAVVVFMALGRSLTLEDRITLRDSLGLISAASLLRLVRYVLVGVLAIEAVGALLLFVLWRSRFGAAEAAYLAVWHSVSAFCNASFDLLSGSPIAPAGFPTDAGTLLVISLLVILGSLGIPVLSDLVAWRSSRRLSLHTRLTLFTVTALLVLGTSALYIGFSQPGGLFSQESWHRRLLMAWFHSASSRTSGFVLTDLRTMAPANVLVLSALMFIGGSPASMGGGITTSTLAVLVLATFTYIRGRSEVTFRRRTLPPETVLKAATIFLLALLFVGAVSWLLMLTQETTLSEALFETVSAFATCGFTLGLTPRLDLLGQCLIALTMFCGRLGVLTVVAALTRQTASLVSYPEEKILIG